MPTYRALDKSPRATPSFRHDQLNKLKPAPPRTRSPLQAFADQFASLATTIQTRLDTSATETGSFGGGGVTVQVERALAQVLRDTPRAVAGPATASGGLPPAQEALRQEVSRLVEAVIPVVERLQPLDPNGQVPSDVTLYKSVVADELRAVAAEVARPERPRAALLRVLLGALVGWPPAVPFGSPPPPWALGDVDRLDALVTSGTRVPVPATDDLTASVGALRSATRELLAAWGRYAGTNPAEDLWSPKIVSFRIVPNPALSSVTQRFARAAELSRSISEDTPAVSSALDAIGFGFSERQSVALVLHTAVDSDLGVAAVERRVTVGDLLDWAAALAAQVTTTVHTAGQLGLTLLADQADELFWLIEAIYSPRASAGDVPAELQDAQVRRELLTLARDLDGLAELAFPA